MEEVAVKVLVTGGAGLIGSHLIRRLLNDGHEVVALDDFTYSYTGKPSASIMHDINVRVEVLLKGARIERCSTMEKTKMRNIFMEFKPDVVCHLAAIPLVTVATAHVESAFNSLSTGLVNVLEIMRDSPWTKRFVYASSSMTYGNFEMDPMPEDGPQKPLNIYGGLKLAGEVLTKSYLYPTGMEHVIVRPSAVYGPTDQHRRVVQKFCENALIGEPVLVKAANDHIMDFTYVEDIAQGFHLACTHANAAGEAFNMTFGAARRLTELVDVIKEYEPSIQTASDDIDDSDRPTRGTLSVEKARTMLGYAPEWPLERGIKSYLEYMRGAEYLNRGVA